MFVGSRLTYLNLCWAKQAQTNSLVVIKTNMKYPSIPLKPPISNFDQNSPEMEGQGRSEIEFTDVETAAESLNRCIIYHVVIDVIGFVLFMHQQIPSYVPTFSLHKYMYRRLYYWFFLVIYVILSSICFRSSKRGEFQVFWWIITDIWWSMK